MFARFVLWRLGGTNKLWSHAARELSAGAGFGPARPGSEYDIQTPSEMDELAFTGSSTKQVLPGVV